MVFLFDVCRQYHLILKQCFLHVFLYYCKKLILFLFLRHRTLWVATLAWKTWYTMFWNFTILSDIVNFCAGCKKRHLTNASNTRRTTVVTIHYQVFPCNKFSSGVPSIVEKIYRYFQWKCFISRKRFNHRNAKSLSWWSRKAPNSHFSGIVSQECVSRRSDLQNRGWFFC